MTILWIIFIAVSSLFLAVAAMLLISLVILTVEEVRTRLALRKLRRLMATYVREKP
jgi:hypothetical protein